MPMSEMHLSEYRLYQYPSSSAIWYIRESSPKYSRRVMVIRKMTIMPAFTIPIVEESRANLANEKASVSRRCDDLRR